MMRAGDADPIDRGAGDHAATCRLAVGPFGLAVRCEPAGLAGRVRARYAACPPPAAVDLVAAVRLVGAARSSSLLDPGAAFDDGTLRFHAPGYEGFVDEIAGRAELSLSSADPLGEVEYLLRCAVALLACRDGGLLLHCAAVVRDGGAYLFFGTSGAGKSTVARASRARGLEVLNDDLVLLMPERDRWLAIATPFWNPDPANVPTDARAPLAGLYRLQQDREVFVTDDPPARAVAELLANAPVVNADPDRCRRLLPRLLALLRAVPVRRLHFRADDSFWDVI